MLLTAGAVPDGERWSLELKWDGCRAQLRYDGRGVTLRTRNGRECSGDFPELLGIADALGERRVILDGELVCLRAGRSPGLRATAPPPGRPRPESRACAAPGLRRPPSRRPLDPGSALPRAPGAARGARARRTAPGAPRRASSASGRRRSSRESPSSASRASSPSASTRATRRAGEAPRGSSTSSAETSGSWSPESADARTADPRRCSSPASSPTGR